MHKEHEFEDYLPEDFMYDPQVLKIVKTANDFCLLLEQAKSGNKLEFVQDSLKNMAELYALTMNLTLPDDLPEEQTRKFVSEADWVYIESNAKERLGSDNRTVDLREPELPGETTETELSECFADIYQTVKDFILLYELGYEEAAKAGIKEYKELFNYQAAPRMLLLMNELHELAYSTEMLKDDQPDKKQISSANNSDAPNDRWVDQFFNDDEKS